MMLVPELVQPMRPGVREDLEAIATEILIMSVRPDDPEEVERRYWSRDLNVLSEWQWKRRARREVLTSSPEPAKFNGMYHRVANEGRGDLNSRDGLARYRHRLSSLSMLARLYDRYGTYERGSWDPYMAAMAFTRGDRETGTTNPRGGQVRDWVPIPYGRNAPPAASRRVR